MFIKNPCLQRRGWRLGSLMARNRAGSKHQVVQVPGKATFVITGKKSVITRLREAGRRGFRMAGGPGRCG